MDQRTTKVEGLDPAVGYKCDKVWTAPIDLESSRWRYAGGIA